MGEVVRVERCSSSGEGQAKLRPATEGDALVPEKVQAMRKSWVVLQSGEGQAKLRLATEGKSLFLEKVQALRKSWVVLQKY